MHTSIVETNASATERDDSRIRVLPDLLVRKIAAGEVIERPASVVKELLDNAIDAGASRIALAIEDGGKRLIRVTDDGGGMSATDLTFAVMPHATSKIAGEDDLFAVSTMGFRGEALASISAVSRMRIVSRAKGSIEGHAISVVAEEVESSQASGSPIGTTIEIRDLFFNVPARRKFMRGASTETGHINEQVNRAALAFPGIAFEVTNNGRTTLSLPAVQSRSERIGRLFSPELGNSLIGVERDERGVQIEAYAAPPAHSRSNAQNQYTFVNGRYIRDRSLQHAMREAYRGLMEHNRHPVAFVFITIDPKLVDVNVHPTKIEVRWADPGLMYSQVLSALRETLLGSDLTPSLKLDRPASRPALSPEAEQRMYREFADMLKNTAPIQPGQAAETGTPPGVPRQGDRPHYSAESIEHAWRELHRPPDPAGAAPSIAADQPARSLDEELSALKGPIRAVQMHNLYIVVESSDGITIIDQHALHERIMYEELKQRLTRGPLESQRLLLPESMNVSASDTAMLEQHADLLTSLGVEVTPFGPDSIAINAFPTVLKNADVVDFLRSLLDTLADQEERVHTESVVHAVLDMMACKAAVKAGDPLTQSEIDALLARRHLIEKSSNCPHGRPTTLCLSRADLDRQFKRT